MMSKIGLALASTALGVIESGLARGAELDLGVLGSLNAGLSGIAIQGMEPNDGTVTAIQNLTDMLFPSYPVGEEAEAPAADDGALASAAGDGGDAPPLAPSPAVSGVDG